MKVLIVGFDGATWELINRFELSSFRKLAEKGVTATMKSTHPPITIPAWPCMFSGCNPGKIGAVDFRRRGKDNRFELVNSHLWRGKLIWDRLRDLRFLVLNIPFTYPPYRINGHMVAIDFSPPSRYTYPRELEAELEQRFGLSSVRCSPGSGVEALYKEEEAVLEVFRYLRQKEEYDVAVVRFGLPDHVTHRTVDVKEIERCHRFMDRLLGEVVRGGGFEHLFLVSDHGVKRSNRRFCINTWLYRKGYLNLNLKGKAYFTLRRVYERLIFKQHIRALVRAMRRSRADGRMQVMMPRNVLEAIDYDRTVAFGILSNSVECYPVYIQANGEGYEELVRRLSSELLEIRDENGERVISRVWTKRELYSGEHMSRMPDLVVESSRCVLATLLPEVFPGGTEYYTHSMDGIFLAYGRGIRQGHSLGEISIYDLAPTLYHLLGFPVPEDADGRVLRSIFEPGSRAAESEPVYAEYRASYRQALKSRIKRIKRRL